MTNHTDTSPSGDLVKMLRAGDLCGLTLAADRIEALEAENERLTLRLAECAAAGSTMRQTIVEFHAENERLRGALREISETPNAGWMIARAALGEK